MNSLIKGVYGTIARITVRPVAGALVRILSTVLARVPGMPIFFFQLPNVQTGCILTLHVLRKIQVATGRRVVVVSTWPFWPADTAKDKYFTAFIKGLTPKFHYIWIPQWAQSFIRSFLKTSARLIQRHGDLHRHVGLQSTARYGTSSTMLHVDILNQGRRVFLEIPKSHEQALEAEMKALGVPQDGWFVCAHAREHGWMKDLKAYNLQMPAGYRHEQEDHRNVDIEDYYPAFEYIVSMGGTVIRMGDPSMKPVVGMKGVIDYPFTEHKSLPMDLYLVSKSLFVLGCNSGFSAFAEAFGVPVLQTNFTALANSARFPYSNNLFLFQHIAELDTGNRLDLTSIFDPALATINDPFHFAALDYQARSNSPSDILEATKEMMYLIENNSFDSPMSAEQERFHRHRLEALDALWSPLHRAGNDLYSSLRSSESRISATFAKRYMSDERSHNKSIQLDQQSVSRLAGPANSLFSRGVGH